MYAPTRRDKVREALKFEQVRGLVMLSEGQSEPPTKRATELDCTWAVRDSEQTMRQRKRDEYQEKMRPLLTRRKLARTRTNTEWIWS